MAIGMGMAFAAVNSGLPAAVRAGLSSLDLDFLQQRYSVSLVQKAFGDLITFSRASSATRINAAGVLETVAAGVPRLDYDPVTLECKGLLIEEQRTNLLIYSKDVFSVWGLVGAGSAKTLAAPPQIGQFTNGAAVASGGADWHRINRNGISLIAGTVYSFTVFCAAGTSGRLRVLFRNASGVESRLSGPLGGSLSVISSAGAITLLNMVAVGGVFIVSGTFTPGESSAHEFAIGPDTATVGGAVVFYGAQLEAGTFPTSYIPTTSAQVTRVADVASINALSPWYNASEGTMFAEFSSAARPGLSSPENPCCLSLETDVNNRMQLRRDAFGGNRPYFRIVSGGVGGDGTPFTGTWLDGSQSKRLAMAVKALDFEWAFAGASTVIASPVATVPAVTKLLIGSGSAASYLNGHIRSLRYYPKRLPSAQLQQITA